MRFLGDTPSLATGDGCGAPILQNHLEFTSHTESMTVPPCMMSFDRHFPLDYLSKVACWNSRGAFSPQSDIAAGKLALFLQHVSSCQIAALLETHGVGHEQYSIPGMSKTFWSPHPCGRMAGGIAVCIRDIRLSRWSWFEPIVPGRVVVLHIKDPAADCHIAFVHLYAGEDEVPVYNMLDRLQNCVSRTGGTWMIMGDFNSISHPADRISLVDGEWRQASTVADASAETIAKRFPSFTELTPENFTYISGATMSVIDKALINIAPTEVMAYNICVHSTTTSCQVSDHVPIVVTIGLGAHEDGDFSLIPRWVLDEPAFAHIVNTQLHQHEWPKDVDTKHALLAYIQDTAWHYFKQDRSTIQPTNHEGLWRTALGALRMIVRGDMRRLKGHLRKLGVAIPVHHGSPTVTEKLYQHLVAIVELNFPISLEKSIRACEEMESDDKIWHRSKKSQLAKVLASWKSSRPRMHLVHLYVDGDGTPLSSPREIVTHMGMVWQNKFQSAPICDDAAHHELARYVHFVDWPDLPSPSCDEFVRLIARQPWTAPGPDLLTYGFLKLIPRYAADICMDLWDAMFKCPESLPAWFSHAWLVIVPKDERMVPERMRPIALKNTLSKLALLPLAQSLNYRLNSWLPDTQQGACPQRNGTVNLLKVEAAAHSTSMLHEEGILVLCDIADAFPSISHRWLRRCCSLTAMPIWLFTFMDYYISSHTVAVRHGIYETNSFDVTAGILQGCVLASWMFIFAFQPVLQMLIAKMGQFLIQLCAFVDDIALVLMESRSSIGILQESGDLMRMATAMAFNMSKTFIMPLTELSYIQLTGDVTVPMQVVTKARYLGMIIGPGSADVSDQLAVEKACNRIPIIKSLQLGIPMGMQLAKITIISVLRYALVHSCASQAMRKLWADLEQALQAGPYRWLGPLFHHAATALRWPCSFPRLLDEQRCCVISSAMRNAGVVQAAITSFRDSSLNDNRRLQFFTQSWALVGILALYMEVLEWAAQCDIIRITGTFSLHWRSVYRDASTTSLRMKKLRKAVCQQSDHSAADLRLWLMKRMGKVWENIVDIRVNEVRVRNLMMNLQRLGALRQPSSCAAILRCAIHGLLLPHRFGQPVGHCCLTRNCQAGYRIQHVIHGGCWYQSLSGVRGFNQIRDWRPYQLLRFLMSPSLSDKELILCGRVAKVLHMTIAMIHRKHPAMRGSQLEPIVIGSWYQRVRSDALESKRCL